MKDIRITQYWFNVINWTSNQIQCNFFLQMINLKTRQINPTSLILQIWFDESKKNRLCLIPKSFIPLYLQSSFIHPKLSHKKATVKNESTQKIAWLYYNWTSWDVHIFWWYEITSTLLVVVYIQWSSSKYIQAQPVLLVKVYYYTNV